MSDWQEEWQRTKRFFNSAWSNFQKKDLETSANRLYFCVERATVSALKKNGQKVPPDHQMIWLLSKKLALNKNLSSFLEELYDLRLQADYGKRFEIVELKEENIKIRLEKAKELLNEIKIFLRK